MKQFVKKLTPVEEDRIIEIEFYLFVKHLLDNYAESLTSIDVIEGLGQLFSCNVSILKQIMSGIHEQTSRIIPTKGEMSVLLYKQGVSLRNIRKATGVHPQSTYNFLNEHVQNGQFEYMYKLEEEDMIVVKSFMTQLKQLTERKY